nr:protein ECERIFERUM 1-like [Ipomoea batatas]GMD78390.1 protein ECERIFERUM 1-like [Ipomoea batatas]
MSECIATKLQIEAMQTVMPLKPTDPRHSRRVSVPEKHGPGSSFRRWLHMILCYNKASDDESGWIVAGWIKESLGRALIENPVLAGRLRKGEDDDGDMEIVSNDCGVRMLEAQINITLAQFLHLKHKRVAESELVFWEDVQESTPQYSPLFYIQVTNFNCGGYSIGISCSLFLADPFSMTSFLNKWSKIHCTMLSQADKPNKIPTFYFPNLRKPGTLPAHVPLDSSSTNDHPAATTRTVIFRLPTKISNSDKEIHKTLAAKCIEEAENKTSKRLSSSGVDSLSWEDLGIDKICFKEDTKAVYFSCWISSIFGEDFVMIVPSPDDDEGRSGHNIIVTISD